MPDLSVIIVNYNTSQITFDCIASIYKNNPSIKFEIIVVDNNSEDESKALLTSHFSEIIFISNLENVGFGRANNIGIKRARGKFILLLNSDTIQIDNAISKMVDRVKREDSSFGLATCQLLNSDRTQQRSVFHYNSSFTEILSYNLLIDYFFKLMPSKKAIKAVHGACIIFEKDKILKIGFFDEDFFLYSEEFEWCYRILQNKLKIKIFEDIEMIHLEGGSNNNQVWNTKQRYLSIALLFKKTRGKLGLILYILLSSLNSLTNFVLLWKMDKKYKKDFFLSQKIYWSLIVEYHKILFDNYDKPLKTS